MKAADNIIYGYHSVLAILQHQPQRVLEIWLIQTGSKDDAIQASIVSLAQQQQVSIMTKPKAVFAQRTGGGRHQGVLAVCQPQPVLNEKVLQGLVENSEEPPLLLVLDGIQDPHNLGACLRTADAAGVTAVIVPKDRAVGLTSTVHATACGAAATVPFVPVTNLSRTLIWLKKAGVWLMGMDAAEQTQSLYAQDLRGACAIVVGGEGKGLRRLTRERCDFILQLPMHGLVSSLNASVAVGICLFEVRRQRR